MNLSPAVLPSEFMRRPHVILMGGQTLPNIIALREMGASAVRVVCSEQSQPRVESFLQACKSLGFSTDREPLCVSAWSLDDALQTLRGAPPAFWEGALLNYTGGTKPMSTAAVLAAFDRGVSQFYVDGSAIWLTDSHAGIPMQTRLGVSELLIANLIPAVNVFAPNARAFTHRLSGDPSREAIEVARAIGKKFGAYRNKLGSSGAANLGTVPRKLWPELLEFLGLSDALLANIPRCGEFLRGQWLEVWAYDFLTRHRESLGIDDVQWSVGIQRPATQTRASEETDLDVAFTHDNQLAFLSCKAAAADELFDEVFEVAERRRRLGGRRGLSGLLHWHERNVDSDTPAQKNLTRAMQAARFAFPPVALFDGQCLRDEEAFLNRLNRDLLAGTSVD